MPEKNPRITRDAKNTNVVYNPMILLDKMLEDKKLSSAYSKLRVLTIHISLYI